MSSILTVKNLNIGFNLLDGFVEAIHSVSFDLKKGETLAIVGESGCGKTISTMSVLRLLPENSKITSGEIIYNGQNLLKLSEKDMQKIRGKKIALIPQDPMTSLNPLYTIGNQLLEIIELHQGVKGKEAEKLAIEALEKVKEVEIKLSKQRKKSAKKLEKMIHEQLSALYMDKAVFEVKFLNNSKLYSKGIDKVEFYIQTNPGEEMGPLAKIASGGELSRIMLALKTIFSQKMGVTSIIFDEVDTGVSGRVAQAIAEKISQISNNSQVLCITHLPQVAAIADNHYYISKSVNDGRTETSLEELDEKQKIREIARMLSGSEITELTLKHAEELIKMSK